MKNICLLIYDLRSGGAEHVLSEWSQLLAKDFNVYMTIFDHADQVCYPYGGKLINLDVPSDNRNALTKITRVLKRARKLKQFVKREKIDMVISFCNECNLVNYISTHSAVKMCSIRSASDVHSNPFVKYVIKSNNNKLIIQTDALRRSLIDEFGAAVKDKLIVMGNPFDTDRIKQMASQDPPKEIAEILRNKKTIVSVASFKQQKNHSGLLRVFEIVAKEVPDAYLLLVGANSTGLQKPVEDMVKKSSYADRIIFTGEQSNPFAIDSRCSVFVLPSLAEGIPNALAEAMICGAPVIAADCPTGPAELLTRDPSSIDFKDTGIYEADYGMLVRRFKGFTGYNYEGSNEEYQPFANAIIKALKDDNYLFSLKEKSIAGAGRFDWEDYRKTLVSLVNKYL